MALARSPVGCAAALSLGAIQIQNSEWLRWPPPLLMTLLLDVLGQLVHVLEDFHDVHLEEVGVVLEGGR